MNDRLLGTPNEDVWPGVGKLPNWHEYPQWNVSKLSSVIPSLDADGIDLLEVSNQAWDPCYSILVENIEAEVLL